MNSNGLFQSIQLLDGQISDYNHLLQQLNRLDSSSVSEATAPTKAAQSRDVDHTFMTSQIATALQPILSQQKSLFYEMERLISTKVDRIEFSQIIQNKANQADVQKILFEIVNAKDGNDLHQSRRLQNLMNESIHSTCSDDVSNQTIMVPPVGNGVQDNAKNNANQLKRNKNGPQIMSFGNTQNQLKSQQLLEPSQGRTFELDEESAQHQRDDLSHTEQSVHLDELARLNRHAGAASNCRNKILGHLFPTTPAFSNQQISLDFGGSTNNVLNPSQNEKCISIQHQQEEQPHSAARQHTQGSGFCCQVCYLEQTNGLHKVCPSIEGSLRDLVSQAVQDENLNRSSFNKDESNKTAGGGTMGLGLSTQVKLGTRLSELQDQIKHIFDGQSLFRKEMEHLKLDFVSKTVSKADFESQMLQKANKQTVANALQRKANKAEMDPRLSKVESALILSQQTNGTGLNDRLDELEKNLQDVRTSVDLSLDEKLSKKVNAAEASLKKLCTRDMQRVDSELLIMNTNISTLTTECRTLDEKVRGLSTQSMEFRQQPEPEKIALQVDNAVKMLFKKIGLSGSGPTSFRDSLCKIITEGTSETLIQTSNKEIQHQTLEMVQKLSKDVYAEINSLDQQFQKFQKLQKLTGVGASNENLNNHNTSGVLLGSAIDPQQRIDIKEVKLNLEHLYLQLQQKANISDVCALLDSKANQEDLDQAVCNIGQQLEENYVRRDLWDEWKQCLNHQNNQSQRESQNAADPGIKSLHSAILNMSQIEPNSNAYAGAGGGAPGYNSVIVNRSSSAYHNQQSQPQVPQSALKSGRQSGRPPQQQRLDSNRSMSHLSTYRTAQTRSRKQKEGPVSAQFHHSVGQEQTKRRSSQQGRPNLDYMSTQEGETSRSLTGSNLTSRAAAASGQQNPIRVISFSIM